MKRTINMKHTFAQISRRIPSLESWRFCILFIMKRSFVLSRSFDPISDFDESTEGKMQLFYAKNLDWFTFHGISTNIANIIIQCIQSKHFLFSLTLALALSLSLSLKKRVAFTNMAHFLRAFVSVCLRCLFFSSSKTWRKIINSWYRHSWKVIKFCEIEMHFQPFSSQFRTYIGAHMYIHIHLICVEHMKHKSHNRYVLNGWVRKFIRFALPKYWFSNEFMCNVQFSKGFFSSFVFFLAYIHYPRYSPSLFYSLARIFACTAE